MSAFHVGQKVVCVDDWVDQPKQWVPLKRGAIYTVSGFGEAPGHILLLEQANPWRWHDGSDAGGDYGYRSRRFRPVAYPKQSLAHDVQLFTKIADRVPAPSKKERA